LLTVSQDKNLWSECVGLKRWFLTRSPCPT